MPLVYPLAENPRDALHTQDMARTLGEAREKAGAVVSLVMEWLRPSQPEREAMQDAINSGVAQGFVQIYEDAQGNPVLAVSFWRRGPAPPPMRPVKPAEPPQQVSDTVNDLYFEKQPSSRRRARARRLADPNQMDLFFAGRDEADDAAEDTGGSRAAPAEEGGVRPEPPAPTKKPRSPRGKSKA